MEAGRPFERNWRDLAVVVGVAWAVRAIFIAVLPNEAHSGDVEAQMRVAAALRAGTNPYLSTPELHWPPFHMVLVYCVDHLAQRMGFSFLTTLRSVLIATETLLILSLFLLLTRWASSRTARRLLLVGVSLNPIAILLVCQHGDNDVIVALFVVLALAALLTYRRSHDVVEWLAACLAVGFGAYAKTVPLALAPLLVPGARASTRLARLLGLAFVVGPAALGVSVIYVLTPHGVTENVFKYRSISGFFGVSGLLNLIAGHNATDRYERGWWVVAALVIVGLFYRVWRRGELEPWQTALLTTLILVAIPALGPGYGPQYVYWFMPVLLVTYLLMDDVWRRLVLGCYIVAIATYLLEYSLLPSQGAFLLAFYPESSSLRDVSNHLLGAHAQTFLRLPLFLSYLTLLVVGWRRLGLRSNRARWSSVT